MLIAERKTKALRNIPACTNTAGRPSKPLNAQAAGHSGLPRPSSVLEAVTLELVDQTLMAEAKDASGAAPIIVRLGHRIANHLNF
jgi:hypothetical protein